MDEYIVLLTLSGIATYAMAWMPALTKRTGISYSVVYVLAGVAMYVCFPSVLPSPLPQEHETMALHLSEMVVIISLMGTGIKIDRSFSLKKWASPLKLISVAMILCIAAAALMGHAFLGLDLAAAVLLGAVLAPTDPVLASDVQVGPPNAGKKSETKFALTAEAGLNDGMAFPFIWLAIVLAIGGGSAGSLLHWAVYDILYKIIAGIIVGYVAGKLSGYLVFRLSKKVSFLKTNDGFLALSMTIVVYGLTEMIHGYGFVSVFICAITFRHFEKTDDYHDELHAFTDQAERLLIAVILILFGGALVSGILNPLTWKMVIFSVVFLFVIRPLAAYISLSTAKSIHFKEKLAISFFGIRGMGSIFYLAFAMEHAEFAHGDELWAMVAFTILLSVVIHGCTARPIMKHLKAEMPVEHVPE